MRILFATGALLMLFGSSTQAAIVKGPNRQVLGGSCYNMISDSLVQWAAKGSMKNAVVLYDVRLEDIQAGKLPIAVRGRVDGRDRNYHVSTVVIEPVFDNSKNEVSCSSIVILGIDRSED